MSSVAVRVRGNVRRHPLEFVLGFVPPSGKSERPGVFRGSAHGNPCTVPPLWFPGLHSILDQLGRPFNLLFLFKKEFGQRGVKSPDFLRYADRCFEKLLAF
jgi:hypothetical protein